MSNPTTLYVLDTSAVDPEKPRQHSLLIEGKQKVFVFKAGERLEMPFQQGIKFLSDGFIVTDEAGEEWKPLAKRGPHEPQPALRPDQVVATLSELSRDALQVRAWRLPGGEVAIKHNASKQDVIDFLMERHTGMDAPVKVRDDMLAADAETEGMTDEEVARMLAEETPGAAA